MSVLYVGSGPTADAPGLVITDEPCPSCGWPETIVHAHLDGRVLLGCASCEVERNPPVRGTSVPNPAHTP